MFQIMPFSRGARQGLWGKGVTLCLSPITKVLYLGYKLRSGWWALNDEPCVIAGHSVKRGLWLDFTVCRGQMSIARKSPSQT